MKAAGKIGTQRLEPEYEIEGLMDEGSSPDESDLGVKDEAREVEEMNIEEDLDEEAKPMTDIELANHARKRAGGMNEGRSNGKKLNPTAKPWTPIRPVIPI